MKKYFNIMLAAWAVLCLAVSCNKEMSTDDNPLTPAEGQEEVIPAAAEVVTISAKLSDVLTRVDFEPSYSGGKPTGMALTWAEGDMVRVYNHADRSQCDDFTLAEESIGQKEGKFTGTPTHLEGATSYDVEVIYESFDYIHQTQPADGKTANLKYYAEARNIADYTDIVFTDFSGILAVTAKMPEGVAGNIKSIELTSPIAGFFPECDKSLTITLDETGDADDDGILHFFASFPGSREFSGPIPLFVRFYAPDTDHTVYTRYIELSELVFKANQLNTININATQSDKHAGTTSCDGSTAEKAYLIGDKYQLKAMADLMVSGETTFFKLIDDIDLGRDTWDYLNPDAPYDKAIDFDGNNKKISNLNASFFYVLKGSVKDLTLNKSKITHRGVLAEFIQQSGNSVTNVTVSNGTVDSSAKNVGGLIGCINKGTSADVVTATITDCAISETNVSGGNETVGGLVGFANAKVIVSGCTYSGGTVTATGEWCGGMFGSTGDYASVISDCHVTNATITSSSDRVGGFAGQIGRNGVTVNGCTVGTESQRVAVHSSLSGATVNLGGFVGVCYGTVTKNGDVRSKAYVSVTSDNTDTGTSVNIGGFVGYLEVGAIDYSDVDATMNSIKGHQVGGFAAFLSKNGVCKVDHCTSNATVSGNNYVGGFIGQADAANHVITNNISSGSVSGAATVAGFIGKAAQGILTGNSTSCTVTASGANNGGFAGQLNGNVTVSKCFATGKVTGNGNVCGGFTGIASNGAIINDCYSTSNLSGGTRKRGGIVGHVDAGTVSINRCYSTSDISNNFEMGGLVGFVSVETFTMTKCAAWNGTLTASSRAANNWSSAACVGVTFLTCTLTDNYRSPDMDLTAYWGTNSNCTLNLPNSFQHPNVSSSAPLTDPDGNAVTSSTMRPYQGKCETGKTLSELASTTLGWSSDVWDFSGALPTLK